MSDSEQVGNRPAAAEYAVNCVFERIWPALTALSYNFAFASLRKEHELCDKMLDAVNLHYAARVAARRGEESLGIPRVSRADRGDSRGGARCATYEQRPEQVQEPC